MKILFINNNGGGFADHIEVSEGCTVQQLFEQRIAGGKPDNYLIRVNRLPASASQGLVEGDRVSVTPTKIEGAHLAENRIEDLRTARFASTFFHEFCCYPYSVWLFFL